MASVDAPPPMTAPCRWIGRRRPSPPAPCAATSWVCDGRTIFRQFSGSRAGSKSRTSCVPAPTSMARMRVAVPLCGGEFGHGGECSQWSRGVDGARRMFSGASAAVVRAEGTGCASSCRHRLGFADLLYFRAPRAHSSVGQSARFTSVRSQVQVLLRPPRRLSAISHRALVIWRPDHASIASSLVTRLTASDSRLLVASQVPFL